MKVDKQVLAQLRTSVTWRYIHFLNLFAFASMLLHWCFGRSTVLQLLCSASRHGSMLGRSGSLSYSDGLMVLPSLCTALCPAPMDWLPNLISELPADSWAMSDPVYWHGTWTCSLSFWLGTVLSPWSSRLFTGPHLLGRRLFPGTKQYPASPFRDLWGGVVLLSLISVWSTSSTCTTKSKSVWLWGCLVSRSKSPFASSFEVPPEEGGTVHWSCAFLQISSVASRFPATHLLQRLLSFQPWDVM